MGKIQELLIKLKNFYYECVRVLKITKKPTNDEFKSIVKITALGITIIGMAGFLVFLLKRTIFG